MDAPRLKWYYDGHRAGTIVIGGSSKLPLMPESRVRVEKDGATVFRGYAYSWEENVTKGTKSYTINEELDLLNWRTTAYFTYRNGEHWVEHIFGSDTPNQSLGARGPLYTYGVLEMANSLLIQNPWVFHYNSGSNWVMKLPSHGAHSIVSSGDSLYADGVLLTEKASYADCQSTNNSWYQDSDNLYVHYNDWHFNTVVIDHNCINTGIICGDIGNSFLLDRSVKLNWNTKCLDVLVNSARFFQLNIFKRYTKTNTILDFLTTDGRGDESTPLFKIEDADILEYTIKSPSKPIPTGLIGTGRGGRDTLARYGRANTHSAGIWIVDTYDVSDADLDTGSVLTSMTDAEWLQRIQPVKTIKTVQGYPLYVPGDWLQLDVMDKPRETLQIKSVDLNVDGLHEDGIIEYELGSRLYDYYDAFQARQDLSDVLLNDYGEEEPDTSNYTKTATTSISDATHTCTAAKLDFTLNSPIAANYRTFLDLSFDTEIIGLTCYCEVKIFTNTSPWLRFRGFYTKDIIQDLDITEWAVYGTTLSVYVTLKWNGDFTPAHASCSGHPVATVTGTCKNVARRAYS